MINFRRNNYQHIAKTTESGGARFGTQFGFRKGPSTMGTMGVIKVVDIAVPTRVGEG